MKIRKLMVLPLAATLMLPAVAQQNAASDQGQSQPAATQNTSQQPDTQQQQNAPQQSPSAQKADQSLSARQPLVQDTRQGFWGKLNPFARKKYVQKQMTPIRDRVNELDELTSANSKMITDVDARTQEGIRQASLRAGEADQHAVQAGSQAQQAQNTAQNATQRLQTVEGVVNNLDQYQAATQVEIRFRAGQAALSSRAKEALDNLASSLKDQRNYIVEVQGFAPGSSQAAVQHSEKLADSVVRYLVINHDVPVYRIFTLGMGNARVVQAAQQQEQPGTARRARGPRVEVTVLKNSSLEQLSAQNVAPTTPQAPGVGTQAAPPQSSPKQQPQEPPK